MNIAVIGTGYVGLVTGVCLAETGNRVTCIDVDEQKVLKLRDGISPIYEPGLESLMIENLSRGRLHFTCAHEEGFREADLIFICVGTPQRPDGPADLSYIEQAARDIGRHLVKPAVIVVKSTVPVGTNEHVKAVIAANSRHSCQVRIVSNPEFLREGSAVSDTFHGDRIVIGTEDDEAAELMTELYRPFGIPVYRTDLRSAEMIKYASNAFLAAKISFINEISNVCEKLGADVESVAYGMGLDQRIGPQFLKAGIGYGGSCFPKDTNALVQIAGNVHYEFKLLKSVIEVNRDQQTKLVHKALERFGSLKGLRVALLGLAFKPHTDDMREAPSIAVARLLTELGAQVVGYDPVAATQAARVLPPEVVYAADPQQALSGSDLAMILTEWPQIRALEPADFRRWMNEPVVFDGRNCYDPQQMKSMNMEYHSIGRASVLTELSVI
ncbi:UDP-glucose dehydrogenase family protein [Paenibacillus gansuensis]|uniref:UDP-glucose 6-dehydrogenase n=1 Tax=Paenibacillus gansuensis TaxID=306542 RepID=A0ABW5PG67_9BACL